MSERSTTSAASVSDDERIIVRDLNIYYGDFLAVQGVNMDIEPRSVTALIGPSGCGKSTFLRSLNRMHEVVPHARVEGKIVIVMLLNLVARLIARTFSPKLGR